MKIISISYKYNSQISNSYLIYFPIITNFWAILYLLGVLIGSIRYFSSMIGRLIVIKRSQRSKRGTHTHPHPPQASWNKQARARHEEQRTRSWEQMQSFLSPLYFSWAIDFAQKRLRIYRQLSLFKKKPHQEPRWCLMRCWSVDE